MSQKATLKFLPLFLCILLIGFSISCSKRGTAELVLTNGKIVTVDKNSPEAQALAVKDGIIIDIGSNEEMERHICDTTEVIDLEGKLAIPGFIEGHGHFTSLGQSKMRLNLMHVKNWDEIVDMVKKAVQKAKPGEWIQGRGWHQEKWDKTPQPNVDGLPFHHSLSKVSPDNPVLLSHASGHASFANAKAMELAGITKDTSDPPGGEIVRDSNGNPIGVFRETAQRLLRRASSHYEETRSPEEIEAEEIQIIELAMKECLVNGVTSFHDAGASFETIDLFKKMAEQGKLRMRLWVMIRDTNELLEEKLADYKILGMADNHLTIRAIKRSFDGALGPHGAWLLEPYEDLSTSVGLNTTPIDVMKETARLAIENDFQLCVHAIGDRANRETLDIFEEAFTTHPKKKGLRWRIEHSQHLHPDDIPRFGQMGVTASIQGIHCTSDGPWVIKRLGEKRASEGAYMWQDLMKTGAVVCNGTDVPVEEINPIACFYATATRKTKDGTAFFPEQKMTREEALQSYTLNCAYAAFQEEFLGSLTRGKLADITVLSKDIMTVPDDEILNAEVVYTIVGGKVMYKK